ncbi:MAG: hypothetical protein SFY92_05815 [Verrucomicrobiae bacterium]|nr:hypothetical protein [Verrucomicrobiae bacterium]
MSDQILFQTSCVREIHPFKAVETNPHLPTDIFPAFLGSRPLSYGLDATGMQGLDSRTADHPTHHFQYGNYGIADDLYVFHIAVKSNHVTQNNQLVRLPLGWLEYALTLDGQSFDTAAILARGKNWRREFNLKKVAVTTCFDLEGIRVSLTSHIGLNSVRPNFLFEFHARDGKPHVLRLESRVNLRLRTGETIFESLPQAWTAGNSLGFTLEVREGATFKVLEPYTLTYAVSGGTPVQQDSALGIRKDLTVPAFGHVQTEVSYYFGASSTKTHGDDLARAELDKSDTLNVHERAMADYWSRRAEISTGDIRRDWLYHFNIYLIDFGTDMRFGAQCSGNFVPFHLGDGVFWDSHYMIDGLLHAGGLEHCVEKVHWLDRVMGREGKRPFYWMCHYNGVPFQDDKAYTSVCAHAMTAARVFLYTRDRALQERCNHIVQTCVQYAIGNNFFEKTPKGWILSTPSTTDVTFSEEFTEGAKNNTYTFCWFMSLLAASLSMAERLGFQAPHLATAREIISDYYLEQNETEYLDQRDGRTGGRHDSYIPVLCYPTEGHRWVNREKYQHSRSLHDIYTNNLAHQNFSMPWPMCWGAASDFRAGLTEAGEQRLSTALNFFYGLGYPAEGNSEGLICTTQPYLSTSGSFLTAQSEQFFYTDFFTGSVGLFAHIGRREELNELSFHRLHGANGLSATGFYTPTSLKAEIRSETGLTLPFEIIVPYKLRGNRVRVLVNGNPVAFTPLGPVFETFVDSENKWRTHTFSGRTLTIPSLPLQPGTTLIEVEPDPLLSSSFDPAQVLMFDYCFLGQGLLSCWNQPTPVFSTQEVRQFESLLPRARHVIFTEGFASPFAARLRVFEDFVTNGGHLMLFYETGLRDANQWSRLTGLHLEHAPGHRWTQAPGDTRIHRSPSGPATLPDTACFPDEPRFKGTWEKDVEILYSLSEGHPYCTWRTCGKGSVLWIASGQLHLTKRAFLSSPGWRDWFHQLLGWWLKL